MKNILMIRSLAVVACTVVLLAIGFIAGRYAAESSTEAGRLLAEELIKNDLVTAALAAEQVRKLRDGQIDEVVEHLNQKIDSSIFSSDILLKNYPDESTRWFADNMLIRIADHRTLYPHKPSPIWEGKVEDIMFQARSRVAERTASEAEAEPVDARNGEMRAGDERSP